MVRRALRGLDRGAHFLDASLTGGLSQFDSDRSVSTNNGIEHAEADYDGLFIAPSITWGMGTDVGNGKTLTPSLRARYAGLFLDGYAETGLTDPQANLTVDDRNIHVLELRGELAFAMAHESDGGVLTNTFRMGVDGSISEGGSVDAVLLGQGISFEAGNDNELARGYAGYEAAFLTDGGSSFHLGAEAGYDTDEALTLQAEAGLNIPL